MLKIWIFRYLFSILSSVLFSQQGFAGNCPSELVALFQNQSFETLLDQQGRLPLANKGEVLDADFITYNCRPQDGFACVMMYWKTSHIYMKT
jgi:hypothetical protein